MLERLRAIRVISQIESEDPVYDYTGRLVKQFIYTINREIRLFHGLRGALSPIAISPPFTPGRAEHQLGTPTIPIYTITERDGVRDAVLIPAKLGGTYIIHIGGLAELVDAVERSLEEQRRRGALTIRFNNTLVTFKVEKIIDAAPMILEKEVTGDKVTLYIKSPAMIFNVFAPTRLPKFSPTAVETLMTPYMIYKGTYTINYNTLIEASKTLGYLVEAWYTPKTLKPTLIPFKGKKEATLAGKIKYIIDTPKNQPQTKNTIEQVLKTAEITGIGESRLNGLGTTTFT